MAVLYSIGDKLVDRFELDEKAAIGTLKSFTEASIADKVMSIEFTSGNVSTRDLPKEKPDALGFEPIGLNKPMTLEVLNAYTGNAPGRSFWDRIIGKSKPDLLMVSATKNPQSFDASPRAINQIFENIEDKKWYRPGALRPGSPIIFHSPAMVDRTKFVSIELVVDSFSGEVFDQLSNLFTVAAGLPVFAPAATFLLAGASVSRMGKKLAGSLSETSPFLKADEDIRLDSAGFPKEIARFMVFVADSDLQKLKGFETKVTEINGKHRVVLVHSQTGKEYDGDVPFVITSLDGRKRPEYKNFSSTHASAGLIEQFYGKDTLGSISGVISDAATLYNDFKYRRSADRIKEEIAKLDEGSDEYKNAKKQLESYLTNIYNDELKFEF